MSDGREATTAVVTAGRARSAPLTSRPNVVDAEYESAYSSGWRPPRGLDAGVLLRRCRHRRISRDAARTGHIAGAGAEFPFTEIADAEGGCAPPRNCSALFAKAGVKPGDTVIGYCHIGQQATAVLFAARTLGHPRRAVRRLVRGLVAAGPAGRTVMGSGLYC